MNLPDETTESESEINMKAALLNKRISESIAHMRQNRRQNRRRASIVRVTAIMLSGVATVLLGLQIPTLADPFKNIAFVLGATVTVLNALEPFFNFRALWLEHEIALANMHRLQDKVEFYLTGIELEDIDINKLTEFHQAYDEIWNSLNQAWISYRKSEKNLSA